MAEIPNGDYIHRSIDQLRNERGVHEYNKHFTDLRNNIVADYAIKVGLNNNNSLIDNRNTPTTISNQSTNHLEQKHQYSTSNTSLDAQMNEGKVSKKLKKILIDFLVEILQKMMSFHRCKNINFPSLLLPTTKKNFFFYLLFFFLNPEDRL